jgi:NTE family protein
MINNKKKYDTLVLSGGSLKCIAQIGCIKYLEENNILHDIINYVASSAGTIVSLFLILNYTFDEIKDFFIKNLKDENIINIDPSQCVQILDTYGINDGNIIVELVKRIIYKKLYVNDINFIELAKITGKNFSVCVSNILDKKTEYFSLENTPELSVITAIRTSCGIPILFTPIEINNKLYVDGGIYDNFPINYEKNNKNTTFGINIFSKNDNTDTFSAYLKCIIDSITVGKTETFYDLNNPDILTMYIDDVQWISLAELKIDFSEEQINFFIDIGYDYIKKHFK